ncbi:MAG: hypothetical protein ACI88A_000939 [Paraglaciecola sp.]|jgi:hypothetical protein
MSQAVNIDPAVPKGDIKPMANTDNRLHVLDGLRVLLFSVSC